MIPERPTGSATTAAPTAKPPRQTWIDQARWVAIALVVIGHFVGLVRGRSELARGISDFVYVFHIPAFVLLAGWGAARLQASGRGLSRIVWQLLLPYALFQLVAFAVNRVLEGTHPSWSFVNQTFGLWFLVALAGWRLLAPWFHGLRAPVLAALVVALLAGMSPSIGSLLSLSRIAFFLPLFIAGPRIVDLVARWRTTPRARWVGAVVLAIGALWVAVQEPTFDRTIFFGRDSYAALHQGLAHGLVFRCGALAISTILAVAMMLVVPGRPGSTTRAGRWFAEAGRHTMFPYLIHLPLLTVLTWTGWPQQGRPLVTAVVAVVAAVVAALILVTPPVRMLAGPIVEPRTWLERWRPDRLLAPSRESAAVRDIGGTPR
jgi:fucose 4-O-acetylase-like acetyltransferase